MNDIVVSGRQFAVQYLRMSTEHQRYSLENQAQAISEYAQRQGYDVIETYADAGRSGLTLKERQSLNRLLRDVTDPERKFSTILVLDVSRWGRFQDPDQHAAYEFLCRDLGVRVEYVSEVFANDGSIGSSILKHMKRIMAGEHSRELSAKVSYGQLRSAGRGQKQGGTLTFGLRRLLVDADGHPKHFLAYGERKSIVDDKVFIMPGLADEQKIIKNIFDMFVTGLSISSIARHLNYADTPSTRESPWSFQKVKSILANELYTGVYVYNRSTQKLKRPRTVNPEALWVRVPVCDGIIDKATFERAQKILASRRRRGDSNSYSSDKMVEGMRRLLAEEGYLSTSLIRACPYLPDIRTYYARFGHIENVYALVGYSRSPKAELKRPRRHRGTPYTRDELIAQLHRALDEHKHLSQSVLVKCDYTASTHAFHRVFGSLPAAYQAAGYLPPWVRAKGPCRYDKAHALNQLKELWDKHGYITTSLVFSDKSMPSAVWYKLHFGSFAKACIEAGIDYDFGALISAGRFRVRSDFVTVAEGGGAPVHGKFGQTPDEELLASVRRIFNENGYITAKLIADDPETPSMYRIFKRYASITHLYAAAGLPRKMDLVRVAEKRRQKSEKDAEKKAKRRAANMAGPEFRIFE